MYLQGNLQAVFDALYHMGVIDPVLEMDWNKALEMVPITPTISSKFIHRQHLPRRYGIVDGSLKKIRPANIKLFSHGGCT